MNDRLFEKVSYEIDPHWVVKEFFNSMYSQNKFLRALPLIIQKIGYCLNEDYCSFPDLSDSDPTYHFEGVIFGLFENQVTITERQCEEYVEIACQLYVAKHPEHHLQINAILELKGH